MQLRLLLIVRVTMGALLSRLKGKLFGTRELRVLMLGLDNAGKTSM